MCSILLRGNWKAPIAFTSRNLFCPPLLYMFLGGALLTPSARPFYFSLMFPYPTIVRPLEFRLVFASLASVAIEDGHSRRHSRLFRKRKQLLSLGNAGTVKSL